ISTLRRTSLWPLHAVVVHPKPADTMLAFARLALAVMNVAGVAVEGSEPSSARSARSLRGEEGVVMSSGVVAFSIVASYRTRRVLLYCACTPTALTRTGAADPRRTYGMRDASSKQCAAVRTKSDATTIPV